MIGIAKISISPGNARHTSTPSCSQTWVTLMTRAWLLVLQRRKMSALMYSRKSHANTSTSVSDDLIKICWWAAWEACKACRNIRVGFCRVQTQYWRKCYLECRRLSWSNSPHEWQTAFFLWFSWQSAGQSPTHLQGIPWGWSLSNHWQGTFSTVADKAVVDF